MFFEAQTPYTKTAVKAYDAIRKLNHDTIVATIPGPHVYGLMGNLKYAGGHSLASLLENCARGLRRSVEEMDVYEDDRTDPSVNAYLAAQRLEMAAAKAREIGELLEKVQSDISGQGYREAGEGGPHDPRQLEEES